GGIAETIYAYDASDNVHRIVDADGIETILDHDYAGRRTAVHREGKTWTYAYDRHGNLVSKTLPFDGGASLFAQYTVTYTYDDLDRLETEVAGSAGVAASTWNRWGASRTTVYAYDDTSRDNGWGNLTRV